MQPTAFPLERGSCFTTVPCNNIALTSKVLGLNTPHGNMFDTDDLFSYLTLSVKRYFDAKFDPIKIFHLNECNLYLK